MTDLLQTFFIPNGVTEAESARSEARGPLQTDDLAYLEANERRLACGESVFDEDLDLGSAPEDWAGDVADELVLLQY